VTTRPASLALSLALACGLASAGLARADAPGVPEPGKLTVASLEKMLTDLGYDFKKSTSTDGKRTYFGLVVKQDNFTFVIDLSLDEQGSKLWFSCPLRTMEHPEKVKSERLWKLLEENDAIMPMSFSYDRSNSRFYLNLAVDNRGLTAKVLREELDRAMGVIRRTYAIWDSYQWPELNDGAAPPANPTPPASPAAKFEPALKQYAAALKEVADLLEKANDETAAAVAAYKLKGLTDRLHAAAMAVRDAGPFTADADKELMARYGAELRTTLERIEAAFKRIDANPAAAAPLKEAHAAYAEAVADMSRALQIAK
jgi:hypothetical protein